MSKVQSYAQDFLRQGGTALRYDWNNMPDIADIDVVLYYGIPVWEYNGQTEWEYYGADKNEGKTL